MTPWIRILPQKLTGPQLVKKKPPAFYGTRRFITALTSARYLPLYPGPDQPSPCLPTRHEDPFLYYIPIYT